MITLICGKDKKEVSIKQAENILYIQSKMKLPGWILSDDSPYEYKENALIKRSDKKDCKKPTKARPVNESKEPRTETKVSRGDDPAKA